MTRWFPIAPGATLPAAPAPVGGQITATRTVPVWNETLLLSAKTSTRLEVKTLNYPLALPTVDVTPRTRTLLVINDQDPFGPVAGNAAPVLGASPATTTTGWTLLLNANTDDDFVEVPGFGFTFYLAGTGYTSCFAGSNGYLTFGAGSTEYRFLWYDNPALPKLLFGPYDNSYQRIYKMTGTNYGVPYIAIRWEGCDRSSGASPGSSNSIYEFRLYEVRANKQYLEVRAGNTLIETNYFTICDASSALSAEATSPAPNTSHVFEGNATGTSWTLKPNFNIPLET